MKNTLLGCIQWRIAGASVLAMGGFLMVSASAADIEGSAMKTPDQAVTYAKDVAPIFQAKCEECHHQGTAAPMPLSTYQEARLGAVHQRTSGHA